MRAPTIETAARTASSERTATLAVTIMRKSRPTCLSVVVPAKAGTHNHPSLLLSRLGQHRAATECGSPPSRGRHPEFSSRASHFGQFDELPGARHVTAGYLDQRRLVPGQRFLKRLPQRLGPGNAIAANAKALGETHEIRVGKVGADQPI